MDEDVDEDVKALRDFKEAVKNLAGEGEDLHEGPLIDLANIFRRIIHNFEHKGIDYVVDRYWLLTAEKTLEELRKAYVKFAQCKDYRVSIFQDAFERLCSKHMT